MANKKLCNALAQLGCIVCRNLGYHDSPAEIHHLREGVGMSQRSPDERAIPLCPIHHRLGGYGVAYHAGKKGFIDRFGTEEELLKQTHDLLIKKGLYKFEE